LLPGVAVVGGGSVVGVATGGAARGAGVPRRSMVGLAPTAQARSATIGVAAWRSTTIERRAVSEG
jgi:hypothetical protein